MSTDAIQTSFQAVPQFHASPVSLVSSKAAVPASRSAVTEEKGDGEAVSRAVQELNLYLAGSRTDLRFTVDQDAGEIVVSIVDSESGQVLRQMPSVEAIRIARHLEHNRLGLIRQLA